jgi:proteasome lid subunit RPN8/RPN11
MPPAIRLKQSHIDEMVAHALEDAPKECCGLLATEAGVVVEVRRARNKADSPYRFDIDGLEIRNHLADIEETGRVHAGIYHSHTGTAAIPSPTDIRAMSPFFGPPCVHFVIGIKDRANPEVRAWYIEAGACTEQEYEIVAEAEAEA